MSVRYNIQWVQWVRRYATAPNAWAYVMFFWLFGRFGVDPQTVLATSSLFLLVASGLSASYRSVLRAWTALHGSLSQAGLIVGSARHLVSQGRLLDLQILLSASLVFESCATPLCGKVSLKLWKTLFFMPLDRKPIVLLESCPRRVASDCLCGHSDETLEHLFFHCLLAQSGLDWIQSLLFLFSPLAPAITVRRVLFGFSSDELLCVPRVFCYLLSLLKFSVWCQRGMNIVFGPNLQVPWV